MGDLRHTPEPWRLGTRGYTVVCDTEIEGMNGANEPEYYGGNMIGESIVPSNARRIVACVNACAGMADPAAEISRLKAEVERLTMLHAALDGSVRYHSNRAETAEAQLAQLRARVRPGVEEIHNIADDFCEAMEASYGIPYDKVPLLAQAINNVIVGNGEKHGRA